ncbi:MAG: site-specific integrase [Firmicutes bacterium]|nr:site-specific integrase [Bacillota bacterium]
MADWAAAIDGYLARYPNRRTRREVARILGAWRAADGDAGRLPATWGPATRRVALVHIRAFTAWAAAQGYRVPAAPAGALPQVPVLQPRAIPAPDLDRLRAAMRQEPEPWRTYWALLDELGLRETEALGLRVGDVSWQRGQEALTIIGKGGKLRSLPLLPSLRVWRLLKARTRDRFPGAYVLALKDPAGPPPTANAARARFRRLQERAGLLEPDGRPRYHIHQLRHSAAARWLGQGMDLRAVQRLLGHASLQVTSVYLQTDDAFVRAELERAERGR